MIFSVEHVEDMRVPPCCARHSGSFVKYSRPKSVLYRVLLMVNVSCSAVYFVVVFVLCTFTETPCIHCLW